MKKMFAVFVFSLLISVSGLSYAQPVQITSNTINDVAPRIDQGQVAWRAFDGNDWEVFVYDSSTSVTTQVTNNTFDDGIKPGCVDPLGCDKPRISQGQVVWAGFDGNDWEIFLYDISAGTIAQITTNSEDDWRPRIDQGQVVWIGFDGNDNEVFHYNSATGITQITNNTVNDKRAMVSQGRITWEQYDNTDFEYEVFLYNIGTAATTQITNNTYNDFRPHLNSYLISWQGMIDADGEVFIYDLASGITTQVTNNNFVEQDIDTDVTDNAVTWDGCDGADCDMGIGDWEIFHYNASTGVTTQITINALDDFDSWSNGGQMVWIGFDGSDTEIFFFDINTGTRLQITNNNFEDDFPPRISQGQITWAGCDGSDCWSGIDDYEIFLYSVEPIPDIEANGVDGLLTIPQGNNLTVTFALDPGSYIGQNADWWILGFYYNPAVSPFMIPIMNINFQAPLFNLPPTPILNTAGLPSGIFGFFYGVDMNPDGVLDVNPLFADTVTVIIQ